MEILEKPFGLTSNGLEITKYTLQNLNGLQVSVINYGGIITTILTPDLQGKLGDIVLGFDSLDAYEEDHPYFGALIGRVGNRIAKGKFTLDGQEYQVAVNNGPNSLHGGLKGFDKVVWEAEAMPGSNSVRLTYLSKDGEENYPGNLSCAVIYTLTEDNELKIDYHATTDKPTPVNLTNHSYFNLSAGEEESILNHELYLNADKYTVVDEDLTPTGELRPVVGTEMDFTSPKIIGSRIAHVAGGYDHNYVLNKNGQEMSVAGRVYDAVTGREMEVYTTQPGVQFYSGNFLDGSLTGKYGKVYQKHYGFCLETQHFPDAPNQPAFPSIILRPGEEYQETTIYKFTVRNLPV
ncbi:aldose epimerase family protein [Adhaeribacter aquaticus]|uniref:aldose epimerase family protein n=1 Tax=Adhaeribacter aquaticus TaxID=299567 RepID=UPI0004137C57|nr:aldose epimerase family protein [Adhaeribacter aquaticus]